MEERTEKPVIFAVITLFITFVIVYVIFFRNEKTLESDGQDTVFTGTVENSWTIIEPPSSWLNENVVSQTGDGWISLSPWVVDFSWDSLVSGEDNTTTGSLPLPTIVPASTSSLQSQVSQLSGVMTRYNSIKMSEVLALSVKFAFVDTGNVLYWYLGTGSIDASDDIIRRLWWNRVEIDTENDINKNLLWWDRVIFVNIPWVTFVRKWTAEQKLLVAMVMEIGEDKRLVQAPFDRYHTSKPRMKLLFEKIYQKFL